jgi:hypothetical protein
VSGSFGTALIAAVALCAAASPAHANRHKKKKPTTTSSASAEKPWFQGVSKEDQKAALALFKAGNTFFEQEQYTEAIAQYEKALEKWDHPSIEYNLASCLIHMRQPLDAWDHLESALQYGAEPLGKNVFDQAQQDQLLLDSMLAQIQVQSQQDDVVVMLDGKELFTGKGSRSQRVMPGKHQLVATRQGYETDSRALDVPAGTIWKRTIELHPEKVTVKRENYERRWPWWVPWATTGSGLALALVGTATYLVARSDMKSYDATLASDCRMGCTQQMINALGISSEESHARHVSQVGIGFWVAGAAVAAAGGIMAFLNRPQLTGETEVRPETRPDVSIIATPSYIGASLSLTFR